MAIYKGWNAKIYVRENGGWLQVGCADSVSFEISRNLEPYFCIGAATPEDIVEGNIEITGSMSRAWVNNHYLTLVTGAVGALSSWDLCMNVSSGTGPVVYLYDCKMDRGSVDIPQDGFLKEDYDFRATTYYVVPD